MRTDGERPDLLDAYGDRIEHTQGDGTAWPKWLSQPIVVAGVGLLLSTIIGGVYWIYQQRYQADSKTLDEAVKAEEEVNKVLGDLLSGDNTFVTAFRDDHGRTQLKERTAEANSAQEKYDHSIHPMELNMARYFPSPDVARAWILMKESLGALDDDALEIEGEEKDDEREHEIKNFDEDISKAETRYKELGRLMDAAIAELRRQRQ